MARVVSEWSIPNRFTVKTPDHFLSLPDARFPGLENVNGQNMGHGVSLSADGLRAVSGSAIDTPRTRLFYVYEKIDDLWRCVAKVPVTPAAGVTPGMHLVPVISADGNTIAVASYSDAYGGFTNVGGLYIFTRNGTEWNQVAAFYSQSPATDRFFGLRLAISGNGDYVAVGEYNDSVAAASAGAVHIYYRTAGIYALQQTVRAADAAAVDQFGYFLTINNDGSVLVSGAPSADLPGFSNCGAAYVFTRSGTVWTQQQKLTAPTPKASASFGYTPSISSDGDTILVGAATETVGQGNAGAAYVFKRIGGVWEFQQQLTYPTGEELGTLFSLTTAMSGDGNYLYIYSQGMYAHRYTGRNRGQVSIYRNFGGTYGHIQTVYAAEKQPFILFGQWLAASNDGRTVMMGIHGADQGGSTAAHNTDVGAADIFYLEGARFRREVTLYPQNGRLTDALASAQRFGYSSVMSENGAVVAASVLNSDYNAAVVVYRQTGSTWIQEAVIIPDDYSVNDNVGYRLAIDSTGVTLAISGHVHEPGIVTDTGAVWLYAYSLGQWVLQRKFTSVSNVASDWFGCGVALSSNGTMLTIGAPQDDVEGNQAGAIYIFTRTGSGWQDYAWTQQARLGPSPAFPGAWMGYSVALSADGNTLVAGAPAYDDTVADSGCAYVYTRSGLTWTPVALLKHPDPVLNDFEGRLVAISGDGNYIATASEQTNYASKTRVGSVWLYAKVGGVWTYQTRLNIDAPETNDEFGFSMALSTDGSVLLVGARLRSTDGASAGRAFIYTRSGSTWSLQTQIPGTIANGQLGSSVSMRGNGTVLAVGNSGLGNNGTTAGAVQIYSFSGSTVTLTATLYDTRGGYLDYFGSALALSEDKSLALIGAYGDHNYGGSVTFVAKDLNGWIQQQKFSPIDAPKSGGFYVSALSGDGLTLLAAEVGAPGERYGTGRAYIYEYYDQVWRMTAEITAPDGREFERFGHGAALSSDGTIAVIGSPASEHPTDSRAGKAYVFLKQSDNTWLQHQVVDPYDGTANNWYGSVIAITPDGNKIAIGAFKKPGVYIYVRDGSQWVFQQKLTTAVETNGFGISVGFSSDGQTLAVGAHMEIVGGLWGNGAVYVYIQSGATWTLQATILQSDSNQSYRNFGNEIALSSDGNTLAVGAQFDNQAGVNAGAVYIFTRSGSVWTQQQKIVPSAPAGDALGMHVKISPDGNTLFLSTTYRTVGGVANAGAVYIFTRSGVLWTQQVLITSPDIRSDGRFGNRVFLSNDGQRFITSQVTSTATPFVLSCFYAYEKNGASWDMKQRALPVSSRAGDRIGFTLVADDGLTVVAVSAYLHQPTNAASGAVYIYRRKGHRFILQTKLYPEVNAASDFFGHELTMSGDGLHLLVGAYGTDVGVANSGSVFYYAYESNRWRLKQVIQSPNPTSNGGFGVQLQVSPDGQTVIIGEYLGNGGRGAAYIFTRSGSTWSLQAQLTAPDAAIGDWFGRETAINASVNCIAVIATNAVSAFTGSTGRIYVYRKIDNAWVLENTLTPFATNMGSFGRRCLINPQGTVLMAGTAAFDGRATDAGGVHLFSRMNGAWTYRDTIYANDPQASASFGARLVTNEDFTGMLVSATLHDSVRGVDSGAVYFYDLNMFDLEEVNKVSAPIGWPSTHFASSAALSSDGQMLVIGSINDNSNTGCAYVYRREGLSWVLEQKLVGSTSAASSFAGRYIEVSPDGSTIAIGSEGNNSNRGAVYIFTKVAGVWTEQAELVGSNLSANSYFGRPFALSEDGNTIAIAAHIRLVSGLTSGVVYIFQRTGTTWAEEAVLTHPTPANSQGFGRGCDITLDGNTVVVGAHNDGTTVWGTAAGSAFVFTRTGSTWSAAVQLIPPFLETSDAFGACVKISDDGQVAFVGAHQTNSASQSDPGAIHVFRKVSGQWKHEAKLWMPDGRANDYLGNYFQIADNGNQIYVGVPGSDMKGADAGAVIIFSYESGKWITKARIAPSTLAAGHLFGASLAVTPDAKMLVVVSSGDDAGKGTFRTFI